MLITYYCLTHKNSPDNKRDFVYTLEMLEEIMNNDLDLNEPTFYNPSNAQNKFKEK